VAARERAADARAGRLRGPLHGIPVGVKDIFHVAGMPTTAGAGPFAHETPAEDAPAVGRLRAAGAVILGKTATTEFAYLDPAATRNPWNREHTPGGWPGSSSGRGRASRRSRSRRPSIGWRRPAAPSCAWRPPSTTPGGSAPTSRSIAPGSPS